MLQNLVTHARSPAGLALILISILTLGRVFALAASPVELYADESQYWVWSWTFDWGYFSKPPLIAWLIAASTSLIGDSDFAVRLPAPLLHGLAAGFIFLIARTLGSAKVGLAACALYLTLPAVWVSGGVISTDALLLPAWSGGLYALVRLRRGQGAWVSSAGLGLAIGLGMLSKYAMIYFILGTGLSLLLDDGVRRALLGLKGALAALIAAALIAPNIVWNAANDFATVSHTAANANWGGDMFHPGEMVEFLTGQLLVFGPALFPVLIAALWVTLRRYFKTRTLDDALFLALFILPPLLTVTSQAFLSRAHANWAASAYVAGTVLTALFLIRGPVWRRWVMIGSIAFHSGLGVFTASLAASPELTEALGRENDLKRLRGWRDTAAALTEYADQGDYAGLVFDDRNVFHQMQRYGQAIEPELYMWVRYSGPHNHADQNWPLPETFDAPLLIVSERPLDLARMREDFRSFEPVGELAIPVGGEITRDFTLWRAQGHQRVTRDAAYEERWAEIDRMAREGG